MTTLIVCAHGDHARAIGFDPSTRRHYSSADVRAWWPGLGDRALRGLRAELIIICERTHVSSRDFDYLRLAVSRGGIVQL